MSKSSIKAGRPSATRSKQNLSDLKKDVKMVRISMDLEAEQLKKLKIYAAEHGSSMSNIVRNLIGSLVS